MDIFRQALETWEKCGRNQSEAAKQLGLSRTTFQGRLRSAKLGHKCEKDAPIIIKEEADATLQKYFDIACERIRKAWKLERSKLPLEPETRMVQRELIGA